MEGTSNQSDPENPIELLWFTEQTAGVDQSTKNTVALSLAYLRTSATGFVLVPPKQIRQIDG